MSLFGDILRTGGNFLLGPVEAITGKNIVSDKATTKYGEIAMDIHQAVNPVRTGIAVGVASVAGGKVIVDTLKNATSNSEKSMGKTSEDIEEDHSLLFWVLGIGIAFCTLIGILLGITKPKNK